MSQENFPQKQPNPIVAAVDKLSSFVHRNDQKTESKQKGLEEYNLEVAEKLKNKVSKKPLNIDGEIYIPVSSLTNPTDKSNYSIMEEAKKAPMNTLNAAVAIAAVCFTLGGSAVTFYTQGKANEEAIKNQQIYTDKQFALAKEENNKRFEQVDKQFAQVKIDNEKQDQKLAQQRKMLLKLLKSQNIDTLEFEE